MIAWVMHELCDPPHKITHPEKLESLFFDLFRNGWGKGYPVGPHSMNNEQTTYPR